MPIIEEEGGRLKAFAKEPQIEVIGYESSDSKGFWGLIIAGGVLLIVLITVTITIT